MPHQNLSSAQHRVIRTFSACLRTVLVMQIFGAVQRSGNRYMVFRKKFRYLIGHQCQIADQTHFIFAVCKCFFCLINCRAHSRHIFKWFSALKFNRETVRICFRNTVNDRSSRFRRHIRRFCASVSLTVDASVVAPVRQRQNEKARSPE